MLIGRRGQGSVASVVLIAMVAVQTWAQVSRCSLGANGRKHRCRRAKAGSKVHLRGTFELLRRGVRGSCNLARFRGAGADLAVVAGAVLATCAGQKRRLTDAVGARCRVEVSKVRESSRCSAARRNWRRTFGRRNPACGTCTCLGNTIHVPSASGFAHERTHAQTTERAVSNKDIFGPRCRRFC